MRFGLHPDMEFKSTKDHSKWAVSGNSNRPWICIGDINRQFSQFNRGGGIVCFSNKKISSLYRNAIDDVECCDSEFQCISN